MRVLKQGSIVFFVLPLVFIACLAEEKKAPEKKLTQKVFSFVQDTIPTQMIRLIAAYPAQEMSGTSDSLVWKDGTKMPWADTFSQKDFQHLLNTPDLEDMFYSAYPKGALEKSPSRNIDPGRVRFEPFFKKMYGSTKKEVEAKLTTILFAGQALRGNDRKWN